MLFMYGNAITHVTFVFNYVDWIDRPVDNRFCLFHSNSISVFLTVQPSSVTFQPIVCYIPRNRMSDVFLQDARTELGLAFQNTARSPHMYASSIVCDQAEVERMNMSGSRWRDIPMNHA